MTRNKKEVVEATLKFSALQFIKSHQSMNVKGLMLTQKNLLFLTVFQKNS